MTCPEPLWFVRSPASVQDFTINWANDLDIGDTITGSTWAAVEDPGLTIVSSSLSDTTTTVTLSGGDAGEGVIEGFYPYSASNSYYHMVNTITTAAGSTDERTLTLLTKDL
jgi:hypothetical protein